MRKRDRELGKEQLGDWEIAISKFPNFKIPKSKRWL
jgi:hypothetical protein